MRFVKGLANYKKYVLNRLKLSSKKKSTCYICYLGSTYHAQKIKNKNPTKQKIIKNK